MKPFFSVVIPTYNRADRLLSAVKSVIAQSFDSFEVIVVDDGSTDDTREVIKTIDDGRISYIFQENKERSAARNNGIGHAKGEYICFLDSDDEYISNHFEVLFQSIIDKEKPVAIFHTGMLRLDEDGIAKSHPLNFKGVLHPAKFIWNHFLFSNTVCAHRSVFKDDRFDERFRIWEDTHLFIRLALKYPFYQINTFTVIQHIHSDSTVEDFFKRMDRSTIEQYLFAVEDLFAKTKTYLESYLGKNALEMYKEKKCFLFFNAALNRGRKSEAVFLNRLLLKLNGSKLQFVKRTLKIFFLK